MFVDRTTSLEDSGENEYLELMHTDSVPTVVSTIGRPAPDSALKMWLLRDLRKKIGL